MPWGRAEFFRGIDGDRLIDRQFEVAYFWRLDPATVMALPLSRFLTYELQAARLADLMRPTDG